MTDEPATPSTKKTPPRQRILDAAAELFNAHGINSVGIDTIIQHAGVAKMTLYHHFESKDDLVAAFLERTDEQWFAWLRAAVTRLSPSTRNRPLAVFDALEEWFSTPEFRGCPFINTQAELADAGHPAREACEDHADRLYAFFERALLDAKHPNADTLAEDLLLLAQGAVTLAVVTDSPDPAQRAKRIARAMLKK